MKYLLFISISFLLLFCGCRKETKIIHQEIIDNYIYEVGTTDIYESNVEKTKEKTSQQYISILYSNLFQAPIHPSTLRDLSEIRLSIGDKQMIDDLFLNNFLHVANVIIPSDADMRSDIDQFVTETYLRFYLRKPSPYEHYFLHKQIEEDSGLSPQHIYSSFALSNEYKYY